MSVRAADETSGVGQAPSPQTSSAAGDGTAGTGPALKGIGIRTAQKIIATLEGKMGKFALMREDDQPEVTEID